jgi:hypothetical protein
MTETLPLRQDLILRTFDTLEVKACTLGGVGHDWRIETYLDYAGSEPHSSYVCVWCRAVACGGVGEPDDRRCMEPYHHRVQHRTPTGWTWPVGGTPPWGYG